MGKWEEMTPTITDAEVEAAAEAFHSEVFGIGLPWKASDREMRQSYMNRARAALTAAAQAREEVMPIAAVVPHDPESKCDTPPGPAPDTQGRADSGQLVSATDYELVAKAMYDVVRDGHRAWLPWEHLPTDTELSARWIWLKLAKTAVDTSILSAGDFVSYTNQRLNRAADRIATLERQLAEAREIIKPFAVRDDRFDKYISPRALNRAREWIKANETMKESVS